MIRNYINIFLFILICLLLSFYSQNKKLFHFNKIVLKGNNHISSELFFQNISYQFDSLLFYDNHRIDKILFKIRDFEKNDIIKNIEISYSLPDEIIVNISENNPAYIIKNKINQFILDDEGQIFDDNFISSGIRTIDLNFSNYNIYNKLKHDIELKELIENINNNRLNNKYLLNSLGILTWFNNYGLSDRIQFLSIKENTIDINLDKTKIIFNNNNTRNELLKFGEIINNQKLLDSLKINQISDLKEINLCFNNQIIIKK